MNGQAGKADGSKQTRQWAYALMISVTAGLCAGRLLDVQRVYEPELKYAAWPTKEPRATPTFGSNDRARWNTMRALVEQGTFAIGHRTEHPDGTYTDAGIAFEDGSTTIDKVLNPKTKEFLSSKPPLLSAVLAGEYWLLRKIFGWSFAENSWEIVRTILFTVNWLPLIIYLMLLARLIDRWGVTDWGRLFLMALACFATFLTTFLIVLNNHTVAAFAVILAIYPVAELLVLGPGSGPLAAWRFAVSGFFSAWTACNELPAASFAAAMFALLLWRAPRQTVLFFVPAALVPVTAFFVTNYLAMGEWLPAYEKYGTEWYNYPGSYWKQPIGIDRGGETPQVYAFHLLIGHHGIFSLTPIFLLALYGMAGVQRSFRLLGWLTLAITAILFAFYLSRTQNYNYGGWTSGARWFFWLIPLWLLAMIPGADAIACRRWTRGVGYLLLALSALSAAYPAWNPWRHPWLYNFLVYLKVINY